MDYIKEVKKICTKHNLRMHLDGARGLNAAVALNIEPHVMVEDFDTLNFCLSKGMGCPMGSLVIGSKENIAHARIMRKLLGGGLRQGGIVAAAGLVSLEDWQEKLKKDHENAKFVAKELSYINALTVDVDNVETNIFRIILKDDYKKYTHV